MEKMNEKVAVPPPAYIDDSDVESIKPEKSAFEEPAVKPLSLWQNNVLLRSNRRRLALSGLVSTIVILAIVLGVLGSRGILARNAVSQASELNPSEREPDLTHGNTEAYCTKWVYKSIPFVSTNLDDLSNKWCAEGGSGDIKYVHPGSPFPDNNEAQCAGWVPLDEQTTAQLKKAFLENTPMSWKCYDWAKATASTTGVGSAATSTSDFGASFPTSGVPVYIAGGVILKAGGVLGALALIFPSFVTFLL